MSIKEVKEKVWSVVPVALSFIAIIALSFVLISLALQSRTELISVGIR